MCHPKHSALLRLQGAGRGSARSVRGDGRGHRLDRHAGQGQDAAPVDLAVVRHPAPSQVAVFWPAHCLCIEPWHDPNSGTCIDHLP